MVIEKLRHGVRFSLILFSREKTRGVGFREGGGGNGKLKATEKQNRFCLLIERKRVRDEGGYGIFAFAFVRFQNQRSAR